MFNNYKKDLVFRNEDDVGEFFLILVEIFIRTFYMLTMC